MDGYVITPNLSVTSQIHNGALVLRNKQVCVPKSIGYGQMWDILDLDTVIKDHTLSLKSMLMFLQTQKYDKPLFMGVKEDKFGNGHYITFQLRKKV